MLIPQQKVLIRWTKNNKKKHEMLGYLFTGYGTEFEIDMEHLTEGSEFEISVICDYCHDEFKKKYKDYIKSKRKTKVNLDCCKQCSGKKVSESQKK